MTRKLFITALLTLAAASASAQVTYLVCSWKGDHPQNLSVDFSNNTVTDFNGKTYPAKISDGSIVWQFQMPNGGYLETRTLNRYTGLISYSPTSNAISPTCEVKASKKF